MDARQDNDLINVLHAIDAKLERIAAALEAQSQTVTMRTTVNGIPTDPHTSYAAGGATCGSVLDSDGYLTGDALARAIREPR